MSTIPVVWATSRTDVAARGYWDQALLIDLLDRDAWQPVAGYAYEHHIGFARLGDHDGAVVVVPGRMEPDADWLQEQIEHRQWVLVIVTSDEERTFPWWHLRHPRMAVWVQTPHPDNDTTADGYLPVGYPTDTPIRAAVNSGPDRPLDWAFAGQVTHRRRREAVAMLEARTDDGLLLATDRFADGVPHTAYMRDLCHAKVAPCPGGPVTPDTFRVWEALEAGAVPIVDQLAGERDGMAGYWDLLLDGHPTPPFPFVTDWADADRLLTAAADVWAASSAYAGAWWVGYKRQLAYLLDDAVAHLSGRDPEHPDQGQPAELITIVVPTSPVPGNPGMGHLLDTLISTAEAGLIGCEVIVTADGVRAEQAHLAEPYYQGVQGLVTEAMHRWERVLPVVHTTHQHQARMLRHALGLVRTPLVLYLEHDCPIEDGIDWEALTEALLQGEANLVRFHHETHVLDEHQYLMPDRHPTELAGLQMLRCQQWSQRPHLARADYYRRVLADHFDPEERWMIEDRMHSVLQTGNWADHRVWMYAQPGAHGIRYSRHTDARGDEPKWVDR